jgi:hypothetical protein
MSEFQLPSTSLRRGVLATRLIRAVSRPLAPVLLALLVGFGSTPALAAPSASNQAGTLSILSNPKSEPSTTLQGWYDAAALVQQIGATGLFQSASWSDLEPTRDNYTLGGLTDVLDTTSQQSLLVNLRVLNTTLNGTPGYLSSTSFDSPLMMTRFHLLIDRLKPHLNSKVSYLAIGNEVDVWLSLHPEQWSAYKAFFADAVSYVHSVAPHIKVGVTTTYGGYAGGDKDTLLAFNSLADVWIVTYYPLNGRFVPRSPDAPMTELPWLVGQANGKQVVLQEVGYPSAAALGSSEQAQAQFVTNVFAAWRQLASRVPFLNIVLMHDISRSMCDGYAVSYGLSGIGGLDIDNWTTYFCSLGLRQANGTAKLAWSQLLVETAQVRPKTRR